MIKMLFVNVVTLTIGILMVMKSLRIKLAVVSIAVVILLNLKMINLEGIRLDEEAVC